MLKRDLSIVSMLILISCQETTKTHIGARLDVFPVTEVHRWEIQQGDQMVGILRLLRVNKPDLAEEFYQVQRPDGQICGEIDIRGRGWRSEPFKKERVFIGMGSMEENCAKLLEVDENVSVEDWNEKAAAEASLKREARQRATQLGPRTPSKTGANDQQPRGGK